MKKVVHDSKRSAVLLVAAVIAALAAAVPGVAIAARAAETATTTRATIEAAAFTVGDGQTGEKIVTCPGSKRVLGGGVIESGGPSGIAVRTSGPLDASGDVLQTDDGDAAKEWYAAVYNGSGVSPRHFRVLAVCSGASDATIEAVPLTVEDGQTAEGSAVCPARTRAVGGGVVQIGPPEYLGLSASGPLDASGVATRTRDGDVAKRWYAAVRSGVTGPRDLKVFAICSGSSTATIEATAFSARSTLSTREYARCPSGKRALGGGVVQSNTAPDRLSVQASGPLDASGVLSQTGDGDVAKQWYGAVYNSRRTMQDFKVLAICE